MIQVILIFALIISWVFCLIFWTLYRRSEKKALQALLDCSRLRREISDGRERLRTLFHFDQRTAEWIFTGLKK